MDYIKLSDDAEKEFLEHAKLWTEKQTLFRELDHKYWKAREDRKEAADLDRLNHYNRHVSETNWHNRIMAACFIVITVFAVRALVGA